MFIHVSKRGPWKTALRQIGLSWACFAQEPQYVNFMGTSFTEFKATNQTKLRPGAYFTNSDLLNLC